MRRNPGPNETNMGVSIQINRTDANLVLINVKTILPTLLTVEWAYPSRRGYYVHIINISPHGFSVYIRYIFPYCLDIMTRWIIE